MIQAVAWVIYLLCVANGSHCEFVQDARITEYVPEMGGANCSEPCDRTASMTPIEYGKTAACGPAIPFGTQVYIENVGWRVCEDRGGLIANDEVDVAVRKTDFMKLGINGCRPVVWVFPDEHD